MERYGVIMAGGGGTRFWPMSRKERPKQLLNLSGKDIMVNETIDRLLQVVRHENMFIVTNVTQVPLMAEETKGRVKKEHILAEPAARNTAACIGYAAMEIIKKQEDGIMCIVPSDAFIQDEEEYARVIRCAMEAAEETDMLVTIGIKPTFPATGYGYIKGKTKEEGKNYSLVEEFVEKPDQETARTYFEDGSYQWNSGMFIWKASTILKKFKELLPDVYDCLMEIGEAMNTEQEQEVIQRVYPGIPKISIDYGIMERCKDVLVVEGDFGWNDVGSLDMLRVMKEADSDGNILYGKQINIDTKDCISYGQDKLIATIGVQGLIIVQTEDALLVCDKNRAQDVKKIVDRLSEEGMEQYL
ncbi:MAG: mannose-1-phosphate guanylyltransferase [Lachnospiraceae bacterium]|nr:mannose-1-phosphate guanylyltransferase [Lachnospiraceae bacterium]